jgi:hypothetical protein
MVTEFLIILGVLALCLLLNTGLLAAIYGKRRPTKILGKLLPSILVVATAFFVLGKVGTTHIGALAAV